MLRFSERTCYPVDEATAAALTTYPEDPRRVVVDVRSSVLSEPWMRHTDRKTGLEIETRRTECGLGCACASEVRLVEVPGA